MALDDELAGKARQLFPDLVANAYMKAVGKLWVQHYRRILGREHVNSLSGDIKSVENDEQYLADIMRCFAEHNHMANATRAKQEESDGADAQGSG